MKKIGILALVIGLLGLIAALSMDTTVETRGSDRVYNIGLINEQQNLLLVFIAIAVVGVVILVSNNRKAQSPASSINRAPIERGQDERTCPFCAERIKAQAVVCRYCGHDVVPLESALVEDQSFSLKPKESMALERISGYLAATESSMRHAYLYIMNDSAISSVVNVLQQFLTQANRYTNHFSALLATTGVVAFIYYAFFFDYSYVKEMDMPAWYAGLHKFYRLEESVSIVFAGLIIYFRAILIKPCMSNIIDGAAVKQTEPNSNKSALSFFGIRIDLVVFQTVIIAMIFVLHNDNSLEIAYALAVLALILGYFLTKTGNKLYGAITFVVGVLYIGYRHFIFDQLAYSMESLNKSLLHVPSYINVEPYLWLLVMSIAVPHVQLLRLGSLRFGNLRGDISPTIMGHEIFIPFISAFVFYILWHGFSEAMLTIYYFLH